MFVKRFFLSECNAVNSGVEVERSSCVQEIGVRSPVVTDLS